QLIIQTGGSFSYDVVKDFARFDIPPPRLGLTGRSDERVLVTRCQDPLGKYDQLVCEHLELQFRRKSQQPSAPGNGAAPARSAARDDRSVDLDILTAHATGQEVTLTSDTETLVACGTDFYYDAATLLTILKGNPAMPVVKAKDGYPDYLIFVAKEGTEIC